VLLEAPFNHNAPKFIAIHSIEGFIIVNKYKEDWDIIFFYFFNKLSQSKLEIITFVQQFPPNAIQIKIINLQK
jgi:uncharacterized membrane protein (DUF4010 family)